MNTVVGKKGTVVLLKSFDSLTAKIGDILDKACGKWYNLQSVVIEAVQPRELASLLIWYKSYKEIADYLNYTYNI